MERAGQVIYEERGGPRPYCLIETYFQDGPLGVTLRRRPETGVVFLHEIIPEQQAVGLDVCVTDELWAVGEAEIGEQPLDKAAWSELIAFVKSAPRPLRMVWRRNLNQPPRRAVSPAMNVNSPVTQQSSNSQTSGNISRRGSEAHMVVPPEVTSPSGTLSSSSSIAPLPPPPTNPFASPQNVSSSAPTSRATSPPTPRSSNLSSPPAQAPVVPHHVPRDDHHVIPAESHPEPVHKSELHELFTRLVVREKESKFVPNITRRPATINGPPPSNVLEPMLLATPSRSLIRDGELRVELKSQFSSGGFNQISGNANGAASLWMKATAGLVGLAAGASTAVGIVGASRRRVILMNDIILITVPTPGNVWVIEYLFDLATVKLRVVGHSFHTSGTNNNSLEASLNALCVDESGNWNGLDSSTPVDQSPVTPESLQFELLTPAGEFICTADDATVKDVWVLDLYTALCACVPVEARLLGWRHNTLLGTLHSAVLRREEDRVRSLLSLHSDGKVDPGFVDAVDEDGYAPLHYACMFRLHGIVRLLHDAVADVTVIDANGLTPLHWAALQLDDYSLGLLSSRVFDLDLGDSHKRTPLVLLCTEGRDISGKSDVSLLARCLSVLLTRKPSVDWFDDAGQGLLHYLSASWQAEAVETLLRICPSLDANLAEKRDFMTPLHYAVQASPIKAAVGEGVRIMNSACGAHTNSGSEREPLCRGQALETIRALLRGGARVNAKDRLGRTPIAVLLDPIVETRWDRDDLSAALTLLISNGARMEEPVVAAVLHRFPDLLLRAAQDKWSSMPPIDCTPLQISLGTYEGVSDPPKNIRGTACNLCHVGFTMFRRQHRCRLCNVTICDDCSKKRCTAEGTSVRTCDSCYNRCLAAQERWNREEMLRNSNQTSLHRPVLGTTTSSASKETLFGRKSATAASPNSPASSSSVTAEQRIGSKLNETTTVLNETHQALLERGEKLSQMANKSEDMANQAGEFARLARQLKEQQQQSRWF